MGWSFFGNNGNAVADKTEEILRQLGFDRIVPAAAAPATAAGRSDYSTPVLPNNVINDAVTTLLRGLSCSADARIDDEDVEAFQRTSDALPALLSILSGIVDSYETAAGIVTPDAALALFALHVSHKKGMLERRGGNRRESSTSPHFFVAAQLDELLRWSESVSSVDAGALSAAAAVFDANPGDMQAVNINSVSGFVSTVIKRRREHAAGAGGADTVVSTDDPLTVLQLLHDSIAFYAGVRERSNGRVNVQLTPSLGMREDDGCLHVRPGASLVSQTSSHYFDDTNRAALDALHPKVLDFGNFCKLMLFVLTDGMTSAEDFRRLQTNALSITHTGTWLCYASWLTTNLNSIRSQLDATRKTYIDLLGEDMLHEMMIKHVVAPFMNPDEQRSRIKPDQRGRFGEEACERMERLSAHGGQAVTIDTLQFCDFQPHTKFGSTHDQTHNPRIMDTKYASQSGADAVRQDATWFARTLYKLPIVETDAPLEGAGDGCAAAGAVLGVRYHVSYILGTSVVFARLRRVCRAWNQALRPFCLHPVVANFGWGYSETKDDVRGSSRLHGMPAHNVHLLERSVSSKVYLARKYVKVSPDGEIEYRMQSFPVNLMLKTDKFLKIRIAAVDGRVITCMHVPTLAYVLKYHSRNYDPECHLIRRRISSVNDACIEFVSDFHVNLPAPPHAVGSNTPVAPAIVSGMFFVHSSCMINVHWTPTASSLSFKGVTGLPLTPLRLVVSTGSTANTTSQTAVSAPFYVLSRKAKQSAVDEAARKRRKA